MSSSRTQDIVGVGEGTRPSEYVIYIVPYNLVNIIT